MRYNILREMAQFKAKSAVITIVTANILNEEMSGFNENLCCVLCFILYYLLGAFTRAPLYAGRLHAFANLR